MKNNRYTSKYPLPARKNKRTLFVEQEELNTVQTVDPEATEQPQDVSLDQKVDRFLIQYEREATGIERGETGEMRAKPAIGVAEALKRTKRVSLTSFIFEQEEDPATAGAAEAPADAGGMDLGGGGDDAGGMGDTGGAGEGEAEASVPMPKINLNLFASRLARLVNNYEALIDPRTIILRRAQTYIAKNYSQKIAKELMTIMELQFNMTTKTSVEKQDSVPNAPFAIGAGMEGGGLGGGGGG